MARVFELFLALRYLRSRGRNGFISFIALISMLGIAVGVAVLVVVLSVMNGFEYQLRERILHMTAHATISGGSPGALQDWSGLRETALRHPGVLAAAPYVEGEGLLLNGAILSAVAFRGIEPSLEETVADLEPLMLRGSLHDLTPRDTDAGVWRIVLGEELARALQVDVGDRVVLVIPEVDVTPLTGVRPRQRSFEVSGIFRVGMYEYDRSLALLHMSRAQTLYRSAEPDGVRLVVDDVFRAGTIAREVALAYDPWLLLQDWTGRHINLFRSIQLTKGILFVILLLVVAVAAFNIVSTLVMAVRDKRSDIAILRTLGAAPRSIHGVFLVQGTVIGLVGTAAGIGLGSLLALNLDAVMAGLEWLFGIRFLAPDVYPVSDLVADIRSGDLLRIGLISLVLSLASALYPAWRAARTQPAEALRHE